MFITIRKKINNQKGFTLVELMVVIAIIGILAAVAVPKFSTATNSAQIAKAHSDLAAIDSAITMYEANNAGAIPTTTQDLTNNDTYLEAWPASPTVNLPIKLTAAGNIAGGWSNINGSTAYTIDTTNGRAMWGNLYNEYFQ